MKAYAWLGIDPGKSGSIALVHRDGQIVDDWLGSFTRRGSGPEEISWPSRRAALGVVGATARR